MAGHSHSSNIRFRKDRVDAKRAKVFAKLARTIMVASRQGGGSLDGNAKLRLAVEKARALSMPRDVIERAIKKGTGELGASDYEEILYEGYGPGGVALMLEILTDNRNRTAAEVREIFEKHHGSLGASGTVAWMFERRGVLVPQQDAGLSDERLFELAAEAGADDVVQGGGGAEIHCRAAELSQVRGSLERAGVPLAAANLAYVARQRTAVADPEQARRIVRLLDALDDHDDVQDIHSNEEFSPAVAEELGRE